MRINFFKLMILLIVICLLAVLAVFFLTSDKQEKQTGNKILSNDNSTKMENIRRPAVAGSFYPADEKALADQVDGFLKNAELPAAVKNKSPKIILIPHAGYDYSGQVAAYGFKLLESLSIRKVIILSSSHHYPVNGAILDDSDSWQTPLGEVALDKDLIEKLQAGGMKLDSELFVPEHDLEVQLPFLQKVLPDDFTLTPILVGDMNAEAKNSLAELLSNNIDENTLVIVSSDMSHYPSGTDATKVDHETIQSILTGDEKQFETAVSQLEKKNIPNALTFMCARPAVELGMLIAEKIGASDIQLLKYSNSGDVTGDNSRVVGYSAIGFFGSQKTAGSAPADNSEKTILLRLAREAVENYVKNSTPPKSEDNKQLNQHSGVFVTLTENGNFRGCIGLMESDQPLYQTVPQMAVAAAVDDPRFSPVRVSDLPQLKYEVSVLSPMKRIKDPSEIKLGIHGVKVQQDGRSGVFLPQVADETGWSLEEFMGHLCQDKAGLPADCWHDPVTEIYIFSAQVFSE
jgi:MEMO1 family protein